MGQPLLLSFILVDVAKKLMRISAMGRLFMDKGELSILNECEESQKMNKRKLSMFMLHIRAQSPLPPQKKP